MIRSGNKNKNTAHNLIETECRILVHNCKRGTKGRSAPIVFVLIKNRLRPWG